MLRLLVALFVLAGSAPGAVGFVVRGRVMMEDGTAPSGEVYIERVCVGLVKRETTTDSNGNFSFQLTVDTSRSDAVSQLQSCRLRAVLGGYRSSMAAIGSYFDLNLSEPFLEVGTIFLRREAKPAEAVISANSLRAPKRSRDAYQNGVKALAQDRLAEARKQLERAVGSYPAYAEAWYYLGVVCERQGRASAAREAYTRSGSADAQFAAPFLRLGEMAVREKKWQEVLAAAKTGLARDATHWPALHLLDAVANFNLGDLDAAGRSAREVVRLDTEHRFPQAEHILGMVFLENRNYPEAAAHLRTYLQQAPQAANAELVRKQLAEIEQSIKVGGR